MATTPPYRVHSLGFPGLSTTEHYYIYGAHRYTVSQGRQAAGEPAITAGELAKMKAWLIANKFATAASLNNSAAIVDAYTSNAVADSQSTMPSNPANPRTYPGTGPAIGGAIDAAKSVGDFISALFDPHLWVRVGEVLIGVILVGVGLAKLSTSAGSTLRSIPLYGKAIPR